MALRTIQSPTVQQVEPDEAGQLHPVGAFNGELLGQQFRNGLAYVDDTATWPCVDAHNLLTPKHERIVDLLVHDFGLTDITPSEEPDLATLEALTAPAPPAGKGH